MADVSALAATACTSQDNDVIRAFLAGQKTGQIVWHVKEGRVMQVDLLEVRRIARAT